MNKKLIDNIKLNFGENIILAYGDWSNDRQMRNYIPTKGVGLKRRLSKEFTIFNVDEYNTSKKCCKCGSNTEKFMKRKNPRPHKTNEILVNGLLRCENGSCGKYFDRDLNGSLNIRKIALNEINSIERPKSLQRDNKKQKSAFFDDKAFNITKRKVKNQQRKIKNETILNYQKCVQKIKKTL